MPSERGKSKGTAVPFRGCPEFMYVISTPFLTKNHTGQKIRRINKTQATTKIPPLCTYFKGKLSLFPRNNFTTKHFELGTIPPSSRKTREVMTPAWRTDTFGSRAFGAGLQATATPSGISTRGGAVLAMFPGLSVPPPNLPEAISHTCNVSV